VLARLNVDVRLESNDRIVLERTIIPWLRSLPFSNRVLFVGCEWFTRGYRKWFEPESYWTLDWDPRQKRYGAKLHITDSMTNLSRYFGAGSLDVVICNGVFGWGLDSRDDVQAAFAATAIALRRGGLFLVGWNDLPRHRPFALESIHALHALRPYEIGPLGTSRYLTPGPARHIFNLYVNP
jgi:hypothetical protein